MASMPASVSASGVFGAIMIVSGSVSSRFGDAASADVDWLVFYMAVVGHSSGWGMYGSGS